MNNKKTMTANFAAYTRAYHYQNNQNHVFSDRYASTFINENLFNNISDSLLKGKDFFNPPYIVKAKNDVLKWIVQTQLAPTPLARSQFTEESLITAISNGVTQYVVLGAGFDTFSLRNKELLSKIKVFEVDLPEIQSQKIKTLKDNNLYDDRVIYIGCDFSKDILHKKLLECGFNSNELSFFSWLGVSYYLTQKNIEHTLNEISLITAIGSSIAFDYADENLFRDSASERVKRMVQMACGANEPMKSCFTYYDIEEVCEKQQFLIYEHLTPNEINERFYAKRHDYLSAFESINLILAVRGNK